MVRKNPLSSCENCCSSFEDLWYFKKSELQDYIDNEADPMESRNILFSKLL